MEGVFDLTWGPGINIFWSSPNSSNVMCIRLGYYILDEVSLETIYSNLFPVMKEETETIGKLLPRRVDHKKTNSHLTAGSIFLIRTSASPVQMKGARRWATMLIDLLARHVRSSRNSSWTQEIPANLLVSCAVISHPSKRGFLSVLCKGVASNLKYLWVHFILVKGHIHPNHPI